eukprot:m.116517 g.116517  ORF g.116517 m.116517 type:complete len:166 (-) comp15403_c2_seq6:718-1215(-)
MSSSTTLLGVVFALLAERCVYFFLTRKGYMLMCEEAPIPTSDTTHFKAYGWQRDGGHANYMVAEEQSCVLLPPNLTFLDGALLACGFGTVYEALKRMSVSGAHALLVTGMGPVGLAACQTAQLLGVKKIFGTDVKQSRLEFAKEKVVPLRCCMGAVRVDWPFLSQ